MWGLGRSEIPTAAGVADSPPGEDDPLGVGAGVVVEGQTAHGGEERYGLDESLSVHLASFREILLDLAGLIVEQMPLGRGQACEAVGVERRQGPRVLNAGGRYYGA